MKSFLDFEEKNVEKAIQKACTDLKISRDKLKYDIISHGSSGIFGLVGAKKALIRVVVPETQNMQSPSQKNSSGDGSGAVTADSGPQEDLFSINALVDEAFGEVPAAELPEKNLPKKTLPVKQTAVQRSGSGKKPETKSGNAAVSSQKPSSKQPAKDKTPENKPIKAAPKKKQPRAPLQSAKPAQKQETLSGHSQNGELPEILDIANNGPDAVSAKADSQPQAETSNDQPSTAFLDQTPQMDPAEANEAAIAIGQELAHKIFKTMDIEAELSVKKEENPVWMNIKMPEPGILIGKRGQTLEAIQYLTDKMVGKKCGKGSRVIFDVEGYVESRKTELTDLADRLASKALKTGKPSTMTRMNAHDRRIVHVALKQNRAVRTQSVGEGYYRKLIIFPKKKSVKKSEKTRPQK